MKAAAGRQVITRDRDVLSIVHQPRALAWLGLSAMRLTAPFISTMLLRCPLLNTRRADMRGLQLMMYGPSPVERALQLARSGDFPNLAAIRKQLVKENYFHVPQHLDSKMLSRQLRAAIKSASITKVNDVAPRLAGVLIVTDVQSSEGSGLPISA